MGSANTVFRSGWENPSTPYPYFTLAKYRSGAVPRRRPKHEDRGRDSVPNQLREEKWPLVLAVVSETRQCSVCLKNSPPKRATPWTIPPRGNFRLIRLAVQPVLSGVPKSPPQLLGFLNGQFTVKLKNRYVVELGFSGFDDHDSPPLQDSVPVSPDVGNLPASPCGDLIQAFSQFARLRRASPAGNLTGLLDFESHRTSRVHHVFGRFGRHNPDGTSVRLKVP